MVVKLLTTFAQISDMERNAAYAMLTCHANTHKLMEEKPEVFVKRAMKLHHDTVLEHIYLTYELNNLSRACLQELARHRHITLSVESTRHTLKAKIFNEEWYLKMLYEMEKLQSLSLQTFRGIAESLKDASNDELKYYLPEWWPTNLVMTANVREMRHIVSLRTAPAALKEFQDLAWKFVEVMPQRFRYLLDCIDGINRD